MAGTHFKGILFSSARALENLKQSMPDQFTYMDDFYEGAVDTTLKMDDRKRLRANLLL